MRPGRLPGRGPSGAARSVPPASRGRSPSRGAPTAERTGAAGGDVGRWCRGAGGGTLCVGVVPCGLRLNQVVGEGGRIHIDIRLPVRISCHLGHRPRSRGRGGSALRSGSWSGCPRGLSNEPWRLMGAGPGRAGPRRRSRGKRSPPRGPAPLLRPPGSAVSFPDPVRTPEWCRADTAGCADVRRRRAWRAQRHRWPSSGRLDHRPCGRRLPHRTTERCSACCPTTSRTPSGGLWPCRGPPPPRWPIYIQQRTHAAS